MNSAPSARQIERWSPKTWENIAGNHEIVRTLRHFAENSPCNLLVTGPWRSGKTRTIKHGIKSIMCVNRSEDLNPCGRCRACQAVDSPLDSYTGLYSAVEGNSFKFVQIDCESVSADKLKKLYQEVEWDDERLIVYLDEVAALGRRGLDTILLKPTDEWPCIWMATSMSVVTRTWIRKREKVEGLTEAARNRFSLKLGTSVPETVELATWIRRRCREWQIFIEDEDKTIPLLMQRASHLIGHVKQPLAAAASRGKTLETRILKLSDVRAFNFEALD